MVCDVRKHVGNLDRAELADDPPQSGMGPRPRDPAQCLLELWTGAALFDEPILLALIEEEEAEVGIAKPHGVVEDRAEDGSEIVGRAADHAQHFTGGRLLL